MAVRNYVNSKESEMLGWPKDNLPAE